MLDTSAPSFDAIHLTS